MIENWGSPPDTNYIIKEINNLQMWCGIFHKDANNEGKPVPGGKYWSNLPVHLPIEEFISWVISTDYKEMYNIDIPFIIQTGEINTMPTTVVDNGEFLFYVVIDYIPPSDWYNVVFATVLAIIFILGLHFFIRR